jgi:hypothetical protein
MRKYLLLLAAAALIAAPRAAHAGYTATTGVDTVLTPDSNGNGRADVGEIFASIGSVARGTSTGTFAAFLPDGPSDPQINNADIGLYGYNLTGAVASVNSPTDVTYTGTYKIQYFDPSATVYDVSTGTFNIDALFNTSGVADLNGTLTQVTGPSNPAFADLSEGGFPVVYKGTYTPTVFGQQGTIQGTLTLRGTQPVPEPGTMALLSTGLLPLLGLRRRK